MNLKKQANSAKISGLNDVCICIGSKFPAQILSVIVGILETNMIWIWLTLFDPAYVGPISV